MEALNTVQIQKDDQEHIFEMLAAVLWLGNVSFQVIDSESHVEVVNDEAIMIVSSLLGCCARDLRLALSMHRFQAGKDNVAKKLTLQQAIDNRDALAKFVYASLFDWLIEGINRSLEIGERCTGRSISILDIYGFESFQRNSFEQFCINYANERLQQHFNRHLFKLEQEEYESDGIDWTKVDFEDNQECLDLFEKRPIGLISLLDEESTFPKATDLTFANKLKQHLSTNACFKEERGRAFSIRHYAGEVLYDTGGFLEKNRDPLHLDTIQLLASCSHQLPQLFASFMIQETASSLSHLGAFDSQKQSVGTNFKGLLFKLMQQLENSTPHFIHCIKPNGKQLPHIFEQDLVLEQLKCCGVQEVVRISRSGYPTRMTHQEFAGRYGFLLSENNAYHDPLSISIAVLQQFAVLPDMYQVGYTKLYFRTGQIAALEESRRQVLQGTLEVQKCFRAHGGRHYFHELERGVLTLQSFVRGENARREYRVLIGLMREQLAWKTMEEQMRAVVQIQSVIRGWIARKQFRHLQRIQCLNHHNSHSKQKPGRRISDMKDLPQEHSLPSVVEELQSRVLIAEVSLRQKEEENAVLREQVKQLEARWLEYEAKMKSMEAMWQRQMQSLQMGLAASKKSLAADNTAGQAGRLEGSPSSCFYDSEEYLSLGIQTPGSSTPMKHAVSDVGAGLETNGSYNAINHLLREFEQKKQNFDDEAKAIIELKSGQLLSVNPHDELRKVKHKFAAWKGEYKVKLRETKSRLHKMGHQETEKGRRTWWGKKIKR